MLGLIGLVGIYVLAISAWVSDDAFITFRTVDNFLNGYGLRWDIHYRVQTYTHPLWFFLLVPLQALFGDLMIPVMILGLVLTIGTLALFILKQGKGRSITIPLFLALIGSRAFVDFSTSGLENPLSYLLIGVFLIRYLQGAYTLRNYSWLAAIMGLVLLNRLDLGVLLIFPLAWFGYQVKQKAAVSWIKLLGQTLLMWSPLIAWEVFSIIYYGFPFPNTYYAKLQSNLPLSEYLVKGLAYFWDAVQQDRMTVLVLLGGSIALLVRREARTLFAGLGILAYLGYVLYIGGDFMSGRFFAVPMISMAFLLSTFTISRKWSWGMCVAVLLISLTVPAPTFLYSNQDFSKEIPSSGIVNERAFYYQSTGLFLPHANGQSSHSQAVRGRELRAAGPEQAIEALMIGQLGYYGGPDLHIVDVTGLADPLLARTPIVKGPWRIGHIFHGLPWGYPASIHSGKNQISNPDIHEYYDHLLLVTQGKIMARNRFQTIFWLNWGRWESLLEEPPRLKSS